MPSPSFSNLVVGTGDSSFDDMISSIKYGLYVCEFLGGGMSNMLAGDFSVNVELGYLIENGRVSGRVKDTMLTGNVYELLKSIDAIESRTHKKGSLYAPHILFRKASITG
jgi:PmbA protein